MNVPCKAQSVGISGFVRCLEETPSRCSFAFPLGSAHFCISQYRLQIAKMSTGMAQAKPTREALEQAVALSG
jgi:hypothetical protein